MLTPWAGRIFAAIIPDLAGLVKTFLRNPGLSRRPEASRRFLDAPPSINLAKVRTSIPEKTLIIEGNMTKLKKLKSGTGFQPVGRHRRLAGADKEQPRAAVLHFTCKN
jgi:hypothetical protein